MKSFFKIIDIAFRLSLFVILVVFVYAYEYPKILDFSYFDFSSHRTYFFWAAHLFAVYNLLNYKNEKNTDEDNIEMNEITIDKGLHAKVTIATLLFSIIIFATSFTTQKHILGAIPGFLDFELFFVPFYYPFFISNSLFITYILFKKIRDYEIKKMSRKSNSHN